MATPAFANNPIRIAFFHTELSRDGPGLLLRDILKNEDPQIDAVVAVIKAIQPDVLVLGGVDWDFTTQAAHAFRDTLQSANITLPHVYSGPTNRGRPTGFDLDNDGRFGEPEDSVGFARFTGENSLAVFSRFPVLKGDVRDDTALLWRDLPDALMPYPGQPEGLDAVLPLSTTSHWIVPINTGDYLLSVGTFFATAPVFDGPEDRNGRRNHDEVLYWAHLLDDRLAPSVPKGLVIAGHANLDPKRGEGRREAIQTLLAHPKLQDPHGDQITVDWRRDDLEDMRVSYVLPDTTWRVVNAGTYWPPAESEARVQAETASRHRLVWVDVVSNLSNR